MTSHLRSRAVRPQVVRRPLDEELVKRGLLPDTPAARRAIASRQVTVDGAMALKANTLIGPSENIVLIQPARFVSRGGDKLQGAIEDLDVQVSGKRCFDAGAGSGGFTDCLLQNGAAHVTAVDVGFGQFDWKLRSDERVSLHERVNLRTTSEEVFDPPFDLVVGDLSFISLDAVAIRLVALASTEGELLLLVKPQFEAAREDVPAGGVVRDPAVWDLAVSKVSQTFARLGFDDLKIADSRVQGARGNQEFFLHARRAAPGETT